MTVFVNVFAVIWLETQTNMWLKNILHTATPSPNNRRNMQQRIYTSKELQAHFFFFFSPFLTISLAAEQSWGGLAPSGWLMSCRKQRTLVNFKKKKNQNPSGCKRDSGMMTKQQTCYITVLWSTERLLTGFGWMWEGAGCVHNPSHPQPAALMSSLALSI